jgi:hypothetical protein
MSKFSENDLNLFEISQTESSTNRLSNLKIINNKPSYTNLSVTSSVMPNNSATSEINNNSVTSSAMPNNLIYQTTTSTMNQLGGTYNKKQYSETSINSDVNNLVSMLTSESHMSTINNSFTSTPALENKLRNLLNQNGGDDTFNAESVENSLYKALKNSKSSNQKGGIGLGEIALAGIGAVALNELLFKNKNTTESPSMTDASIFNTSTKVNQKNNQENSINNNSVNNNSVTSSAIPSNKNLSETSEEENENENQQDGGSNPALVAFRDIIKLVVKELDVKYPIAMKVAGQLQKDVKDNNKNVTPDNLVKLATEQLKTSKSKYQKMAESLTKK